MTFKWELANIGCWNELRVVLVHFGDDRCVVGCFTFSYQLLNVFLTLGSNNTMLNGWRQLAADLFQVLERGTATELLQTRIIETFK